MGLVPSQYAGTAHTERFGLWPADREDQKRGIMDDSRVLVAETSEVLGPFPRGSPTSTHQHPPAPTSTAVPDRGGQSQTFRAIPALQNLYFIIKEPWKTQPTARSSRAPIPPAPGMDWHRRAGGDGTGTSQPSKCRGQGQQEGTSWLKQRGAPLAPGFACCLRPSSRQGAWAAGGTWASSPRRHPQHPLHEQADLPVPTAREGFRPCQGWPMGSERTED